MLVEGGEEREGEGMVGREARAGGKGGKVGANLLLCGVAPDQVDLLHGCEHLCSRGCSQIGGESYTNALSISSWAV